MRRLLTLLLLSAALAGPAFGGAGTQSQYVTTMTFQNGVAPTSGYTGCASTYIASRTVGAGPGNYGGCDTLNISSPAGTYGTQSSLLRFDISALPDSAVIIRARLWMYQINPSTNVASTWPGEGLALFRMTSAWGEGPGACGGEQNGYVDNDSAAVSFGASNGALWLSNGTSPASGQLGRFWVPMSGANMDSATLGTEFAGSDTLTGRPLTGVSGIDHPADAESFTVWRAGTFAARRLGWVVLDVTRASRLWQSGAVNNNGVIVKADPNATATATIAFASDEYAWVHRRPKLVIDYLDPETLEGSGGSGGGSVRRVVGGR
jgi:hypothetical protein